MSVAKKKILSLILNDPQIWPSTDMADYGNQFSQPSGIRGKQELLGMTHIQNDNEFIDANVMVCSVY